MNKVAHYLQEHLVGEVYTSVDALRHFSTDESIFQLMPALAVYPRSENDVRKTARFTWQLAERDRNIPITARGMGTDNSGASLGAGIALIFPAHMHKIIELDPKTGVIAVEAGALFGKVQQTLQTHGRYLPVHPINIEYSTIGGAVMNNQASSRSYKYGCIRDAVRSMRVVLSNGEIIETGRLSKRELGKKMGLASMEGELYRALDKLIEENIEFIKNTEPAVGYRSAGYDIWDVKRRDGSFDLTPLIVGSQGTLGLVTEVTIETVPHNPIRTFMAASFSTRSDMVHAVSLISKLSDGPASIDMVDRSLLSLAMRINPSLYKGTFDGQSPESILIFEFDNDSERAQHKLEKKVRKILEKNGAVVYEPEGDEVDKWQVLRDSSTLAITHMDGVKKAIPVIDDAIVPVDKLAVLMDKVDNLMVSLNITQYSMWGRAGDGVLHVAPVLDISQTGDRQKAFKLADEYYTFVLEQGGAICGDYAEGRARGAVVAKYTSEEMSNIMKSIKKIFDPHSILNPGVKIGVDEQQLKSMLRNNYALSHQYTHLPRA